MKIEHIAIYTTDLERECAFFEKYFGARLEAMTRTECLKRPRGRFTTGFSHIAISVWSKEKVSRFKMDGFEIASPPRTTGDGYFESVVLDFDGNFVEITV